MELKCKEEGAAELDAAMKRVATLEHDLTARTVQLQNGAVELAEVREALNAMSLEATQRLVALRKAEEEHGKTQVRLHEEKQAHEATRARMKIATDAIDRAAQYAVECDEHAKTRAKLVQCEKEVENRDAEIDEVLEKVAVWKAAATTHSKARDDVYEDFVKEIKTHDMTRAHLKRTEQVLDDEKKAHEATRALLKTATDTVAHRDMFLAIEQKAHDATRAALKKAEADLERERGLSTDAIEAFQGRARDLCAVIATHDGMRAEVKAAHKDAASWKDTAKRQEEERDEARRAVQHEKILHANTRALLNKAQANHAYASGQLTVLPSHSQTEALVARLVKEGTLTQAEADATLKPVDVHIPVGAAIWKLIKHANAGVPVMTFSAQQKPVGLGEGKQSLLGLDDDDMPDLEPVRVSPPRDATAQVLEETKDAWLFHDARARNDDGAFVDKLLQPWEKVADRETVAWKDGDVASFPFTGETSGRRIVIKVKPSQHNVPPPLVNSVHVAGPLIIKRYTVLPPKTDDEACTKCDCSHGASEHCPRPTAADLRAIQEKLFLAPGGDLDLILNEARRQAKEGMPHARVALKDVNVILDSGRDYSWKRTMLIRELAAQNLTFVCADTRLHCWDCHMMFKRGPTCSKPGVCDYGIVEFHWNEVAAKK